MKVIIPLLILALFFEDVCALASGNWVRKDDNQGSMIKNMADEVNKVIALLKVTVLKLH